MNDYYVSYKYPENVLFASAPHPPTKMLLLLQFL